MIYSGNDTRNKIFGFAVSHLNSDQNAVNYSQKLRKFIKSIQVKFSRLLNDDETQEFNQVNFIRPKFFKTGLRHLARACAL